MSDSSIKMKSHSSLLAFKIKKKLSEVPYNDFLTTTVRPEYTDNIQNGLLASRSHDRIRQLTNTFNILQALDIFMLFYYYQLDFQGNLYSPFWLILTYIVHLVAAVLLGVVIYVEYDSLDWKIKCSFNTGQKIAELIAFVVVHPVPWISGITFDLPYDSPTFGNLTVPIEVNYIILLITIMKGIGIFLAKFLINSQYMQPRASRIKKIYSVTAKKIIYAIRCIFRDKPIRMFFSYFIIGTTFFSFSLKVIESNVPEPKNPFLYYQNCVWYMLITTTTTGYGQIRPYTHVGYCCIVVATLFGSFCISGTVFILLNALTLSAKEQAGLTAFRKVTSHLRYKENCRLYIRMTIWRLWTNHKNKRHVKESFQERKLRAKLRQIRLQGKSLNSTGNIIELCQRQFDSAFINTNFLCENNVNLVNFINSHIFSEDLFRERGMYTRSYITESREVTSEDDQSEDEYTKLRRKKLYKRSHFAESRKNIQSRKHIKIRVLKEPSFGGDEEIGEIKIH